MSSVNNTSYICEKLIEISTRNCNNNNKLLEIPNQTFIFEDTLINSLNTIATRDIACLNSLNMLNKCCKHYITIKYKE
jgi:hypothetical protein